MTNPTAPALLEMEETIDDLEGIADTLYKVALSGDAGEGESLSWLARVSERTVKKLKEQWEAARGPNPGPVLVVDGAEGGAA